VFNSALRTRGGLANISRIASSSSLFNLNSPTGRRNPTRGKRCECKETPPTFVSCFFSQPLVLTSYRMVQTLPCHAFPSPCTIATPRKPFIRRGQMYGKTSGGWQTASQGNTSQELRMTRTTSRHGFEAAYEQPSGHSDGFWVSYSPQIA